MSEEKMHAEEVGIDAALAKRLLATQFPKWADLPITSAVPQGWDNRTFRSGEHMTVRLPSADRYAAQVEKEYRWLLRLAPHLPLPIPVPLARGAPADGYRWPWSVYRWIEGDTATVGRIDDPRRFATALARFLTVLQRIDPTDGPPGPHNFFRGGSLMIYNAETRQAITALEGEIDTGAATAVWEAALAATWHGLPVWVDGDVTAGNLLVEDDRLSAVIDFGTSGVGDPSCDLVISWMFEGEARNAFRTSLELDDATWTRGRGWTLWKALITLADHKNTNSPEAREAQRVIDEVLADLQHTARARVRVDDDDTAGPAVQATPPPHSGFSLPAFAGINFAGMTDMRASARSADPKTCEAGMRTSEGLKPERADKRPKGAVLKAESEGRSVLTQQVECISAPTFSVSRSLS